MNLRRLSLFPADRLAISSWCWASAYYAGRFSLFDLPERAAAAGILRVEANDFMLPPPRGSRLLRPLMGRIPDIHEDAWRYRPAAVRQFKKNLDQVGAACLSWTLNTDFSRDGPGRRLYRRWGLMAAAAVGATVVRLTAGSAGVPVQTIATNMARFVTSSARSFPQFTLVLENHGGISSQIEIHLKIFEEVRDSLSGIARDRFFLCLDPANVPEGDPTPHWQQMASHASHIHLKGTNQGRPVDLERLHAIIEKAHPNGFRGWYIIEDLSLLD